MFPLCFNINSLVFYLAISSITQRNLVSSLHGHHGRGLGEYIWTMLGTVLPTIEGDLANWELTIQAFAIPGAFFNRKAALVRCKLRLTLHPTWSNAVMAGRNYACCGIGSVGTFTVDSSDSPVPD